MAGVEDGSSESSLSREEDAVGTRDSSLIQGTTWTPCHREEDTLSLARSPARRLKVGHEVSVPPVGSPYYSCETAGRRVEGGRERDGEDSQ